MKTPTLLFGTLSLILAPALAPASFATGIDDSDLSGGTGPLLRDVSRELTPDEAESTAGSPGQMELVFRRKDHGEYAGVAGLRIRLDAGAGPALEVSTDHEGRAIWSGCKDKSAVTARVELKTSHFTIRNWNGVFFLKQELKCGKRTELLFEQDSAGGQALGIWQIAHRAQSGLEASVGLQFWRRNIDIAWPSDGDYYAWGTVNVTRGDHWDVVGHELGHAIYDQAGIGSMGGGSHKIDECYSQALALSEGWASYFSAWLSVRLDDGDAKFEYLVPRRAPIRFEHIPADVCRGERNEWRVTGFFWDLIDFNRDNESADETFARVWKVLESTSSRSASDAASRLKSAGMDSALIDLVWELNFLEKLD